MEISDLLDEAKKAQGFQTDMALAKAMKISRSAVSAWRHGTKTPDTVQCAALAGFTGLPLAKVLGIAGEARATSREEKAVWRKLAATAAMALCAVGFAIGSVEKPQQIHAVGEVNPELGKDAMHIMYKLACRLRWIWLWLLSCLPQRDTPRDKEIAA